MLCLDTQELAPIFAGSFGRGITRYLCYIQRFDISIVPKETLQFLDGPYAIGQNLDEIMQNPAPLEVIREILFDEFREIIKKSNNPEMELMVRLYLSSITVIDGVPILPFTFLPPLLNLLVMYPESRISRLLCQSLTFATWMLERLNITTPFSWGEMKDAFKSAGGYVTVGERTRYELDS
jgi:hypothetical protein